MAELKAVIVKNNFHLATEERQCDAQLGCPVATAIDVIGGKWKVIILYQLRGGILRFGELKHKIPGISQKTLTQQLRALEQDKLVTRRVYAEVPPRVEYALTVLAERLNPVLDLLCDWGKEYQQEHL
jgi:DNA-binding HxlR family transcriptional regulator